MHTVFLNEYIHPDALEKLKRQCRVVNHFECPDEIEGIIIRNFKVDKSVMVQCKNLKVIGKHGVGCNTIDLDEAEKRGIIVLNTPLANTNSVAELIVGLMLNAGRNITLAHQKAKEGEFEKIAPTAMTGMELNNKVLGLIGIGNIAKRVAQICHYGFGMRLIGYDPYVSREQMREMGCEKRDTVPELLSESDVVNVSVPLTPDTENLIAGNMFDCLKKDALLINAARGGIVNEKDLYEALQAGRLRAAACDAFVEEPPTKINTRLYELDRFIGTPHIGACTEEALWRMGDEVVEEVVNVLDGKEPKHRVGRKS